MAIQLSGSLAITGSLTATSQIIAQTLNVQQVTSSIVYSSGSNIFGNSVSNTQQFTGSLQVSSSTSYILGNVGIGTTSPTYKLDVQGTYGQSTTSTQPFLIYGDSAGVNGLFRVQIDEVNDSFGTGARTFLGDGGIDLFLGTGNSSYTPSNTYIALNHSGEISMGSGAGTKHLVINTNGNVGIGSTTPAYTLNVSKNVAGDYVAEINNTNTTNGFGLRVKGANGTSSYILAANDGTNEVFIVRGDGRVGIGTTSPSTILHLVQSSGPTIRLVRSSNRFDITGDTDFMELNARDASTYMIFKTADTERIRITSGGNVGIGTTSPSQKLEVNLGAGNSGIVARFNAPTYDEVNISAGLSNWIGTNSTSAFSLRTNNTDKLTILSGGNVGIGTTSPSSFLHVNSGTVSTPRGSGFSKFFFTGNNASTTYFEIQTPSGSTGDILFSDGASGDYGIIGYDHANDSMRFYTKSTINMFISGSGLVGIGTTSPTRLLELYGPALTSDTPTLRISSADSSGTRKFGIEFYSRTGADVRGKLLVDNNGRVYLDDNGGGGVVLQANGGTGNVGIGTTSPSAKLHVEGTFINNGTTGDVAYISSTFATAATNGRVLHIRDNKAAIGTDSYVSIGWTSSPGQDVYIGKRTTSSAGFLAIQNSSATELLTIDLSAANVGIGTTSPTAKIHVNNGFFKVSGTDSDQYFLEGIRTGTSTTLRIYDNASVAYYDSYNSMVFRANQNGGSGGYIGLFGGNVGIGTTSPYAKLSVVQDITTTAEFGSFGQFTLQGATNANKLLSFGFNTATDVGFIQAMVNGTSYNNLLLNARGGNVGIGTTSPSARFQVTGSTNTVNFQGSGSNIFTVDGTSGRLFSVDDDLTNSLFSVNTIAGLPVIEAFADNTVRLGKYSAVSGSTMMVTGSTVAIGTTTVSTEANLFLGAQGTTEGGQLVLQKGTTQTYATHLDNYTDRFRVMSGTNTGSSTEKFSIDMSNGTVITYGNILSMKSSGGGTYKQTVVGQTTAASSGTAKKIAYVGFTHSVRVYIWADQSTAHGSSAIADICTVYGSSSGGTTVESNFGNVTDISVAYNNGGSPAYTIDVTLTYSGTAPTINYVIEGINWDNNIYTL